MSNTSSDPSNSQIGKTVLPPAGLFRRLAAMGYDFLLLAGLSMGYWGLALAINNLIAPNDDGAIRGVNAIAFQAGWAALFVAFFTFFWHRGGQTLGMRAWRIQILNEDGSMLSIPQGILRCLLATASITLAGIGYWWCLFDRKGQTLHDNLSRSVTVSLPKPPKSNKKK